MNKIYLHFIVFAVPVVFCVLCKLNPTGEKKTIRKKHISYLESVVRNKLIGFKLVTEIVCAVQ